MNVNLAPVLHVYYKSGNFIDQFQRSYSRDPNVVSTCGQAFITAQQATGVAATAEHFPGLGSATRNQNTDVGPVTLTVALTKLRSVDEVPYPAAVMAGVKLVMLSWAIYPALDANPPAGLSPTIIGQELRSRNGSTGVTITDALEAGALSAFGTTGQRAVTAAAAGMDLILCSARNITQAETATSALPLVPPLVVRSSRPVAARHWASLVPDLAAGVSRIELDALVPRWSPTPRCAGTGCACDRVPTACG